MSGDTRLGAPGFTITLVIDVAEPLRVLLTRLLSTQAAALIPVSGGAPSAAGKARQVADEPGASDVSSQTSPAAPQAPPAPFPRVPRMAKQRGGRPSKFETAERYTWLTTAWWDGASRAEALAGLNALTGEKLPAEWAVSEMVKRLGLKRSPEALRRIQLAKVEMMRAARSPNPAPPPAQAPATAPKAMSPSSVKATGAQASKRLAPRIATSEEILRWGAEHGCRQDKLDLDKMNARCRELGVASFELKTFKRQVA